MRKLLLIPLALILIGAGCAQSSKNSENSKGSDTGSAEIAAVDSSKLPTGCPSVKQITKLCNVEKRLSERSGYGDYRPPGDADFGNDFSRLSCYYNFSEEGGPMGEAGIAITIETYPDSSRAKTMYEAGLNGFLDFLKDFQGKSNFSDAKMVSQNDLGEASYLEWRKSALPRWTSRQAEHYSENYNIEILSGGKVVEILSTDSCTPEALKQLGAELIK